MMNALKAFKTAGFLMLMTLGTTAMAQQQQTKKPTVNKKTETSVKGDTVRVLNKKIVQDGKSGTVDSTFMWREKKSHTTEKQEVKTPVGNKPAVKKVVDKIVPNPQRIADQKKAAQEYKNLSKEEKEKRDLNWITGGADAYNKRVPKTVTVKDTILLNGIDPKQQKIDSLTNLLKIYQQDSVNRVERLEIEKTFIIDKTKQYRYTPWRFSVGGVNLTEKGGNDILQHPAPPSAGNNNEMGNPSGSQNGTTFRITTPQGGPENGNKFYQKFGNLFNASLTVNIFKDIKFASVAKYRSLFSEDFEALDVTMHSADQRNSAQLMASFNPRLELNRLFRKDPLPRDSVILDRKDAKKYTSVKFNPELGFGFDARKAYRVDQIPANYQVDNPADLPQNRLDLTTPKTQNIVPAARLGASLIIDFNEAHHAKNQRGFFIEASYELLKTFGRDPSSQSPFSNQNKAAVHGADYSQFFRVGAGYRIR